jgi:threonine/homoserine/homoserine lactone efflux protein
LNVIEPATLLVFVVASLALIAIPGPNHLYIVARGIAQGRRAGVASAFGVEIGTLVHIAAAAAGLTYLIAQSATLFGVLKWAGAAYLIYLGIRALTSKEAPEQQAAPPERLRRVFLEGVLVNVLNPKVILFFLAFLPQFVDPARDAPAQILILGLVTASLGLASNLVYAVTAGTLGDRLRHRALKYVRGVVYLALGIATALSGSVRRTI